MNRDNVDMNRTRLSVITLTVLVVGAAPAAALFSQSGTTGVARLHVADHFSDKPTGPGSPHRPPRRPPKRSHPKPAPCRQWRCRQGARAQPDRSSARSRVDRTPPGRTVKARGVGRRPRRKRHAARVTRVCVRTVKVTKPTARSAADAALAVAQPREKPAYGVRARCPQVSRRQSRAPQRQSLHGDRARASF